MEEMVFALEAVLTFVFMLACGYFLKQKGILTESFRQQGDALCFRFLFPVLVFQNIYTAQMPQTGIEILSIPRNLITVIFYYQISLKSLKTLDLSQVSFPLLFPLCYIVPPVFTNSDKGKYKGKKLYKTV